jgi:Cysteine-rich secretory protein family
MIEIMKKYFIPNEHNEYKPHVLRKTSLSILAFIAVLIFFAGVVNVELIRNTNLLSAVISRSLVTLTNSNRVKNQIGQLTVNPLLEKAAQQKADDMAAKNYFAHTSPEGKAPWYWFRNVGYNYTYAGENLAINFTDSEDVAAAWMNSTGHRANILNGKFTEIGIATAKGQYNGRDTVYVVQMFGKPAPTPTELVRQAKKVPKIGIANAPATPTVAEVGQSVLGVETEMYATMPELEPAEPAVPELVSDFTPITMAQSADSISLTEKALLSPKKTNAWLYLGLAGLILVALVLAIFIEIRKQHPKNVLAGSALLLLIVTLLYIYQNVLFGQVFVL